MRGKTTAVAQRSASSSAPSVFPQFSRWPQSRRLLQPHPSKSAYERRGDRPAREWRWFRAPCDGWSFAMSAVLPERRRGACSMRDGIIPRAKSALLFATPNTLHSSSADTYGSCINAAASFILSREACEWLSQRIRECTPRHDGVRHESSSRLLRPHPTSERNLFQGFITYCDCSWTIVTSPWLLLQSRVGRRADHRANHRCS